jgi:membrane protein YdbS with pleckstrin-like domain
MTGARWLLFIPAIWLILMYAVHTQDPVKAVVGWAIIFAPLVVAICVTEVLARIAEWWHHRR